MYGVVCDQDMRMRWLIHILYGVILGMLPEELPELGQLSKTVWIPAKTVWIPALNMQCFVRPAWSRLFVGYKNSEKGELPSRLTPPHC